MKRDEVKKAIMDIMSAYIEMNATMEALPTDESVQLSREEENKLWSAQQEAMIGFSFAERGGQSLFGEDAVDKMCDAVESYKDVPSDKELGKIAERFMDLPDVKANYEC